MSTLIMAACWPLQSMSPAQKSVLISLADQANDDGVCWPGVDKICMRTCLSERAVRDALAWLEAAGAIYRQFRHNTSTSYTITPSRFNPEAAPPKRTRRNSDPDDPIALENGAPPADGAPGADGAPVPADGAPRPANGAPPEGQMAPPNRKGTTTEPKGEPSEARGSRLTKEWSLPEDWLVWAVGEQPTWNPAHAMRVAEQFRDYWVGVPGAKGRKTDWQATWRNWVRREKPMRAVASTQLSAAGQRTLQAGEDFLRED